MIRTRTTRRARSLGTLIALSVLALATPSEGRAVDCGTEYLLCVTTTIVDVNSSDVLHDRQCWGEYIQCVGRMIMMS